MSLRPVCVALGLLAGWAVLGGCSKTPANQGPAQGPAAKGRRMPFPVEVALTEARRVEYTVTAVGSVEAFEVVSVTARVAGVVEQVRFAEGQRVTPGQTLVEIEPERYRLAVQAARATLTKAEAARAEAEASLRRREGVVNENPGLIPGEEVEGFRTRVSTATAEVSQARAALDLAELNLRDAFVRVPLAGIIQTRTVQTGQYVQPGVVLATLVRRDPLLLRFQVPEQDAAALRTGIPARFTVGENRRPFTARITAVGEAADPTSRMVAIAAVVDDPQKGLLRPGTFAQVAVPVGSAESAAVIPQIAVRPSERGFLAFVVEDTVARERVLQLGMRTADGLVEVRSGVRPGEQLVVYGSEALYDGAPVRPETRPAADRPAQGAKP